MSNSGLSGADSVPDQVSEPGQDPVPGHVPDQVPITPPDQVPTTPPDQVPMTPPDQVPDPVPVTPPELRPDSGPEPLADAISDPLADMVLPPSTVSPMEVEVPTIVVHDTDPDEDNEAFGLEEHEGSEESLAIKGSVGFRLGPDSYSDDAVNELDWDEGDEMDDELARSDHTFEKLLEIYQFTIAGLDASEREGISLEPIKKLFQAVWDGVEQSHQNVVNLQQKDYEISADLSTVMAETRTLIKLAEDDPELASRLKAKLEVAWNLADVGELDEAKNNARIMELKDEIAILNRNIMAASKAQGQETIVELLNIKAELEGEKQNFMNEVAQQQTSLDMIYVKRQNLAETKMNLEEKMKLLIEEERVQKAAVLREFKRKEAIDVNVKLAIAKIRDRAHELRDVGKKIMVSKGLLLATERNVRDQRIINEETQRGMELSGSKAGKLKADYEAQTKLCHKLTLELFKKQADLKEREDELQGIRQEVALATRQLTSNLKKVAVHKVTIAELEADREVLKAKLAVLERELELAQKRLEENKRKIEELDKNRSAINRTLQRASAITNEHISQAMTHEMAVKNLQSEIVGYDKEIAEQQKCIARLERERDNYSHEALKLGHEVAIRLEEVKKLDLNIFEYRKRLGEIEDQLKKIQQIYETAVYDRALLQRTLTETQKEIYTNNLTISHLGHKIKSLIFQVGESDNLIHREVMKYERLIKDTVFFTGEAKRIKGMAHDVQRMVEALDVERSTLGRTVAEAEGEISKQRYYANSAESRKAMFYRKLMSKEQELRDIWNKWRVLHSTIRIGAYHFRNLMAEIRQIRYSIFLAKKERLTFSSTSPNMRKLTHEVVVLENIISQETCMCNTLRESMKHPINVHRWRVLQATDPDAYDMVLKVNLLTKRLVERNSIITDQSVDLAFKQEIYCQIRDALKKSPGLEAPENVLYHRHLQKAKIKQYDALKYELKAAESQTEYYEEEIRRLQDRIKAIKLKYFRRQKEQGKKVCNEYVPLQMELVTEEDSQQDKKFHSLAAGMEWQKSDASSLTMYTGESEEGSGEGPTEEQLAQMKAEKLAKKKRKFKTMRIRKGKVENERSSCGMLVD